MSPRRAPLGGPKGAKQTAQAARSHVLGSRLRDDSEASNPADEASPTQVHPTHTPVTPASEPPPRPRRKEPAGKTRKTYYLADDTVAALDDAVDRIRAALGGRIDRHEAIGAVITAGAAQTDQIVARLRAELLRELAADDDGGGE